MEPDLRELQRIRRLVIIALFSNDDLMQRLVLKGGNALELLQGGVHRVSWDLDFSMEKSFREQDLSHLNNLVTELLQNALRPEDYEPFDVVLTKRPEEVTPDLADFWGGYRIEFKIIKRADYDRLQADVSSLRRHAMVVAPAQRRKLQIDISKHEYCTGKQQAEVDGYTIYLYTPAMMVFEKLRAICQQMPEYCQIVRSESRSARARDFFDIYNLLQQFPVDFTSPNNVELLQHIFEAKRVPLQLIGNIPDYRDYHRQGFPALQATVASGTELRPFDFYFDFVIDKCRSLEPLWNK